MALYYEIRAALQKIRNQTSITERGEAEREFIELLEGKGYQKDVKYTPEQLYFICDAYTKSILNTYLFDPQKVEIVLASFAMLAGSNLKTTYRERHIWYIKQAFGCNAEVTQSWFDETETGKANNLRKKEDNRYFKTIAENLLKTEKVGALGLFDEVVASLQAEYPNFPAGLPKELPLIAPRLTHEAQIEPEQAKQTGAAPDSPNKKRVRKIQLLSIGSMLLFLVCLSASVGTFVFFQRSDNTIQSISVLDSEIMLYPGGYERLQIATVPDDTDRDALECHSDSNPWITATKTADWEDVNPWTEAWSVAAENDWGETLPYSGKVSVMGGEAIPVYIAVTVEEPAYKAAGGNGLLNGSNDTPNAGEYIAP